MSKLRHAFLTVPSVKTSMRISESGNDMLLCVDWVETQRSSISVALSPNFIFAPLLNLCLRGAFDKRQRDFKIVRHEIRDYFSTLQFDMVFEDSERDAYFCNYENENVKLNLADYLKACQMKEESKESDYLNYEGALVKKMYTGNLSIDLSVTDEECEISIIFAVGRIETAEAKYLPMNYILLNQLNFIPQMIIGEVNNDFSSIV